MTEGGSTTLYRYDGGDCYQELNAANGSLKVEFVRGSGLGGGIGSILYSDRPGESTPVEYFAYNAVGHTVALTDGDGDVTKTDLYEAFGNIDSSYGSSDNNRLANTKERSAALGLDNHGFRYYDPEIGRYLTRDPIGYGDGLNVYIYVGNNPINGIDPTGLGAVYQTADENGENVEVVDRTLGNPDPRLRDRAHCGGYEITATSSSRSQPMSLDQQAAFNNEQYRSGMTPAEQRGFAWQQFTMMAVALGLPDLLGRIAGSAGAPQNINMRGGKGGGASGDPKAPPGGGKPSGASAPSPTPAQAPLPESPPPEKSGGFNYRGVHAGHPALAAARQGRVVPGNVNGTVTPDEHSLGGVAADSPFTAWTPSRELAAQHALKQGPGGVILRLPVGKPPPGATWSWEYTENPWGEPEVLLRGTREGAEVMKP